MDIQGAAPCPASPQYFYIQYLGGGLLPTPEENPQGDQRP